jgi:hypothetical protein
LNPGAKRKKAPDPSITRTDKDWVMILIGLTLIALFAYGGYTSMFEGNKGASHKIKGPVKDPKNLGMVEPSDYRARTPFIGPSATNTGISSGKLSSAETDFFPGTDLGQEKTHQTGLRVISTPLPGGSSEKW